MKLQRDKAFETLPAGWRAPRSGTVRIIFAHFSAMLTAQGEPL
ncbi:MAG: hypothetical protein WB676_17140 [Bryobacteraceae bacterium]